MQSIERAIMRGNAVRYYNYNGVSVLRRKGTPRQVYRSALSRKVAPEVETEVEATYNEVERSGANRRLIPTLVSAIQKIAREIRIRVSLFKKQPPKLD
jgi:hypothetical protein